MENKWFYLVLLCAFSVFCENALAYFPIEKIWESPSPQFNGGCVAIGNQGTLVYQDFGAGPGSSNPFSSTFSTADINSPTAVSQSAPNDNQNHCVTRSAEDTDVRATLVYARSTPGAPRYATLRISSLTPSIQNGIYQFPFVIGDNEPAPLGLGISGDGTTIVATAYRRLQNKQAIWIRRAGEPDFYTEILTYFQPMGIRLSADGLVLYINSQTYTLLYDTQQHAVVYFQSNMEYPDAGLAINRDGSVYSKSFPNDGRAETYRKEADGAYHLLNVVAAPAPGFRAYQLALSDDGHTLIETSFLYMIVIVRILDVSDSTPQLLFQDQIVGDGPYWNTPTDLVTSDDASTFAVGVWGNQAGTVPQVSVYARNETTGSYARVFQSLLSGSVFDLDMTPDGSKLTVSSINGHADFSSGGAVTTLLRTKPEDLKLGAVPHAGGQPVTIRFSGSSADAGASAKLLQAPTMMDNPKHVGNVGGMLCLNRNQVNVVATAIVDASGQATFSVPAPATIGATQNYQALLTKNGTRSFGKTCTRMTGVP